jgi:2-amino-4-hydroxy-6-hydroxymethyldihydropteridine diphosphokinase
MFGSNLGDRYAFLRRAFDLMSQLTDVKLSAVSGIYETEPVEVADQPSFLNVAASISTSLTPFGLLRKLKEIESRVGRIDRGRWREREIDIDIIFYGDEEFETKELTIPHPKAHLRKFVLQALSEIAPDHIHPVFHKTVSQLLLECGDGSSFTRIEEPLLLLD